MWRDTDGSPTQHPAKPPFLPVEGKKSLIQALTMGDPSFCKQVRSSEWLPPSAQQDSWTKGIITLWVVAPWPHWMEQGAPSSLYFPPGPSSRLCSRQTEGGPGGKGTERGFRAGLLLGGNPSF